MSSRATFKSFNPRNNSFNDKLFHCSSAEEIEKALVEAESSFYIYNNLEPSARSTFLHEIKNQLCASKNNIKSSYIAESGLNEERFEQEFTRTINQLHLFAEYLLTKFNKISSFEPKNTELNRPSLMKKKSGIGPILVLGSSNFPLAYSTIGGDSVSALAAGCPVIVKAHPMHVATSSEVANCVFEALKICGLPNGVFAHLIDNTHNLASKLAQDKRIKGIGFTGSIRGGRALMDIAANRPDPIPVFAEMGSTNPVIVFPHELIERKANWSSNLAQSICSDAGQFCTKPGVILIPNNDLGKEFGELIIEKVLSFESYFMHHPKIHDAFEKLKKQRAFDANGELFEKIGKLKPQQGRQGILKTTISKLLEIDSLNEEVFGPFALIAFYDKTDDLLHYLNAIQGQLTLTFLASKKEITENNSLLDLAETKAGRIIFNGVPTGITVCESMNHSGPYPASSDMRFTALGTDSMNRFLKSVTYQNFFE